MSCPSCGHPAEPAADHCRRCGFSLRCLHDLLGARQVVAEPLIDHASCLSIADSQSLRMQLDLFERRFPQVAVTVFLGDLPAGINPAMAGVWLLNQAVLERQGQPRQAAYALAIIVNPVTAHAGVAAGYALEPALSAPLIRGLLGRASPALWHREHAKGVQMVLAGLDKALRKHGAPRRRLINLAAVGRFLGLRPAERKAVEAATPP